jgi:bacillopeptidase F
MIFALLLAFTGAAQASVQTGPLIDPALVGFAHQSGNPTTRVIALFQAPTHLSFPPKNHPAEVVAFLQNVNALCWQRVQSDLGASVHLSAIRLVRLNWINDSATFEVTPAGLKQLAQSASIKKIYSNQPITMAEKPIHFREVSHGYNYPGSTPPYDFNEMSLTQLIQQMPQIDGTGVLIGSNDTGVDGTHPALQGKIFRFYDLAHDTVGPAYDSSDHGTHTTGTMVGGNRTDNIFGVAPGAQVMMAGGNDARHDSLLDGMAYMLDPDGDKSTTHVPHMINNSWAISAQADVESYYRAISAWDAAGIFIVFSAGNDGPNPQTIDIPHEHPATFAVAASGMDGNLMDFSSRGPAIYQGQTIQKPDLTAPGEGIMSCIPKNDYAYMDGTSMAAPHVTGVAALMLQANPALTSAQIRQILDETATPRKDGSTSQFHDGLTWDAGYGFGKINALEAVKAALQLKHIAEHAGLLPDFLDSLIVSPSQTQWEQLARQEDGSADNLFDYPFESTPMVPAELLFSR